MPENALTEGVFGPLLEAAPDGILVVARDGTIRLANSAAEALFGYRRTELIGLAIEELVPQRFRRGHVAQRDGYHAAPRSRPMGLGLELAAQRSDGTELPVEISLAPMEWEGEQLTVTVIRDARARLAAEESRRDAAVSDIVSGLDAIVWESSTPDRSSLSFLGGNADALLGYKRDEWLREGFWLSAVHPEDRLTALTFAETAQEKDAFVLEYRLIASDGRVLHVRDSISVLRDEHAGIDRLRGVIVDVTERRELEERLVQSQKLEAVGQLAGGIAHDFNNLLTIVAGHSRRIARSLDDSSLKAELAQVISAADRAGELTQQLLTFARRSQRQVEQIDLNETARKLEPLLRRLLDADIAFDVRLGDGVPQIEADRTQLDQVLMNLVINARDAMPAGGMLAVSTEGVELGDGDAPRHGVPAGSYATVTVADTGEGIPPDVRARIFEPFFTTKGPGKGTGLGLATVLGIVQQAGGYIDLDSEPGRGTRFTIGFPAAAAAPATPTRATVLVCEDEPALRQLAVMILEDEGYEVLEAGNGRDAVALAERHRDRIDLLITDVVMPQLSGPELARQLQRIRPDLQVLFMSGYNDSRLVARGIEESKVELIVKPFRPDDLVARVEGLLRV